MITHALKFVSVPVALFIGTIGAVSVIKAVYIDKRELKCACVGGDTNVPLGFVSLTENVMMVAMALWMLTRNRLSDSSAATLAANARSGLRMSPLLCARKAPN